MVKFTEDAFSKQDHFFVKEDPARIYRGLKDLLVNEFDIDRIEEGHMEFNVQKPKDKIKLHAFKDKSPHTTIHYNIQLRVKPPKSIYKMERPENIYKSRVKVGANVITIYPGAEPIPWEPNPLTEDPDSTWGQSGLKNSTTKFQKSKLYEILVGIWYKKIYSKEIETYEEEAEETGLRIHNLMREKFGVQESIHRSGASQYRPPWR